MHQLATAHLKQQSTYALVQCLTASSD
jgi:hypothetical protein